MRWVITGTRDGRADVERWLDTWREQHGAPSLMILGDARGVDTQAKNWAEQHDIPYEVHVAHWREQGRKAGVLRNEKMVDAAEPGDYCLAFPGKKSIGTWHCVRYAKAKGLEVMVLPGEANAEEP